MYTNPEQCPPPPNRRDILEMTDVWIGWLFDAEYEYCEHAWVADDYAGPESGYMGVTCSKCGSNHGEYLY